jgi:hypothetical protein
MTVVDLYDNILKNFNFAPSAIVIAPNLSKELEIISKKLPNAKIISDAKKCPVNSLDAVFCVVDLSVIKGHESTTKLNFNDYLKFRNKSGDESLETVYYSSLLLKEDGEVVFFSPFPMTHKENVVKVLTCCKFKEIEIVNEYLIKAKKRKLIKYEFDKGRLVLEEAHHPELIEKILDFSEKYYREHGFNFRKEIDRLFTKHSDYFVVIRKKTDEILAISRHVWHIPGHFLPLMLATKINSGEHLSLTLPDKNHFGEFAGLYVTSFSGGKAYKEVMGMVFKYVIGLRIDRMAFTTYLKNDIKSGELYEKIFGFNDFVAELVYGDFGGIWMLLKGEKTEIINSMEEFLDK